MNRKYYIAKVLEPYGWEPFLVFDNPYDRDEKYRELVERNPKNAEKYGTINKWE